MRTHHGKPASAPPSAEIWEPTTTTRRRRCDKRPGSACSKSIGNTYGIPFPCLAFVASPERMREFTAMFKVRHNEFVGERDSADDREDTRGCGDENKVAFMIFNVRWDRMA